MNIKKVFGKENRRFFLAAIIVATIILLSGCGKDSESGGKNPTPPPLTTLQTLANGKIWNAISVSFTDPTTGSTVTRTDGFASLLANGLTFTGTNADESSGTFTNSAAGGNGNYVSERDKNNTPFAVDVKPTAYPTNPIFIIELGDVTSNTLMLEIQDPNGGATVKYTDGNGNTYLLSKIFVNMQQ